MGLFFRHPASFAHETGSHPERPARLAAIERTLDEAGWPGLELREAPRAEREQLLLAHTPEHLDAIEGFCAGGGGMIDADTVAVDGSWEAALRAAGAAVAGAEALLDDGGGFAFCALRPPGHHAESNRAMGFCLLNNAAIAAAAAIDSGKAERALILDWDVHHGNGSAEIFEDRDDVVYVSIHQSPLYPGTGHPHEAGTGAGLGCTVNLPVPAGADGERFLSLLQHVVAPLAREHGPDLLVISAGYDAHADDPLADCRLQDADFAEMTATMRELGAELNAPLLFCLEGGYDLGALSRSVLATVRAAGDTTAPASAPVEPAAAARERLAAFWPSLA